MAEQASDYYKILGAQREDPQAIIQEKYRRLAAKHHPDVNPGDENATILSRNINEAYTVLRNSDTRAAYDTANSTAGKPEPAIATITEETEVGKFVKILMNSFEKHDMAKSPLARLKFSKAMEAALRPMVGNISNHSMYSKNGVNDQLKDIFDFAGKIHAVLVEAKQSGLTERHQASINQYAGNISVRLDILSKYVPSLSSLIDNSAVMAARLASSLPSQLDKSFSPSWPPPRPGGPRTPSYRP